MECKGFDGAVMLLPAGLRQTMYSLLTSDRRRAEEIRLRVGRCPAVVLPEGEIAGGSNPVTAADDMADEIAARKGIYKQINDAAKKARVLRDTLCRD